MLIIGLIQTGAFLLLNTWALSEGGPGKTSVLVFTMPFWVLVFAWPILHERIHGLQWIAVVLASLGLVFVLEPWQMHTSLFSKTLAVIAGMCWAIGVIYAKKLHNTRKSNRSAFTFWQMIVGLDARVIDLSNHVRSAAHCLVEYFCRRDDVQRRRCYRHRLAGMALRIAPASRRHHQPVVAGHSGHRNHFILDPVRRSNRAAPN